ncbi:hypothetical protein CEXT_28571 [Caerostris extrusa]|uniref:Uncharacterized protein n=1 Tax=Caerostris extrusa TaxID=172846 RepID=A0AAV4MTQ0_CAEEX|nr:hypothetical protein CEXT_28571 [Caerostris extrusa]
MDGPEVTSRNALPFLLVKKKYFSSIDGQLSISETQPVRNFGSVGPGTRNEIREPLPGVYKVFTQAPYQRHQRDSNLRHSVLASVYGQWLSSEAHLIT